LNQPAQLINIAWNLQVTNVDANNICKFLEKLMTFQTPIKKLKKNRKGLELIEDRKWYLHNLGKMNKKFT